MATQVELAQGDRESRRRRHDEDGRNDDQGQFFQCFSFRSFAKTTSIVFDAWINLVFIFISLAV